MIQYLWRPWWTYQPGDAWSTVYSWFNVLEGLAWFGFAIYVLWRYRKHRRSSWELAYAGLFVLFGISDWLESRMAVGWLVLGKGAVLAGLLAVRYYLVKYHYKGYKF